MTRDAETRYLQDGTAVANLSLVFSHGPKPKDGGYRASQFVDATLWGKPAEALSQYPLKGTRLDVVIDGPHIETFPRKDGTEGSKLVGRVNSIEFAGDSKGDEQEAPERQAKKEPVTYPAKPITRASVPVDQEFDDDIPF
jgi:single-strand DNA-binding protein